MSIMKSIRAWFTKDLDDTIVSLHEQILTLSSQNQQLAAQRDELEQEVAEYHAEQEAENQRYSSTEPWVEIKSSDYDDVKGFRIELDWNEAFIQHLKEVGIKGATDEEAIQKWLGLLYADVIEDLENKSIDVRSSKPASGDYV